MNIPLTANQDESQLSATDFVRANSDIYEWLVKRALSVSRENQMGEMLSRVKSAANFAATFHTGRFADGAIENLAHQAGLELPERAGTNAIASSARNKGDLRRVLHVASHVVGIGGHTRMIYNWVRNDTTSRHALVITEQPKRAIPQWLHEAISGSGGSLIALPASLNSIEKAQSLREISRQTADLVVLHHDGHDVVPVVAFSVKDCPPVAVLNHADHQFWLGSSVSDLVINLRSAAVEHTKARRFVCHNVVLPVPLEDRVQHESRREVRRTLGIPEQQIMLLSVGRPEKFRPSGKYDFASTVGTILDSNPRAHMYVVGETYSGIADHLRSAPHQRLHFVGAVEDPHPYRVAADVYLELFPFGSQTALLEAALCGLPVVRAYAPLFPLLVANDDTVNGLISTPVDEKDCVDRVTTLIQQPRLREALGSSLREGLLGTHSGEAWRRQLDEFL